MVEPCPPPGRGRLAPNATAPLDLGPGGSLQAGDARNSCRVWRRRGGGLAELLSKRAPSPETQRRQHHAETRATAPPPQSSVCVELPMRPTRRRHPRSTRGAFADEQPGYRRDGPSAGSTACATPISEDDRAGPLFAEVRTLGAAEGPGVREGHFTRGTTHHMGNTPHRNTSALHKGKRKRKEPRARLCLSCHSAQPTC